jgi:hypothetical protein
MKALPYLKKNRLTDVLWLLQILAIEDAAHRNIDTLYRMRPPLSAETWQELAEEHPEIFRIATGAGVEISLYVRHYNEGYQRLSDDLTIKMIEFVLKIYTSQIEHSRWWTYLITAGGAFIGSLAALLIGTHIK